MLYNDHYRDFLENGIGFGGGLCGLLLFWGQRCEWVVLAPSWLRVGVAMPLIFVALIGLQSHSFCQHRE